MNWYPSEADLMRDAELAVAQAEQEVLRRPSAATAAALAEAKKLLQYRINTDRQSLSRPWIDGGLY